jgi:hypothetical protein
VPIYELLTDMQLDRVGEAVRDAVVSLEGQPAAAVRAS